MRERKLRKKEKYTHCLIEEAVYGIYWSSIKVPRVSHIVFGMVVRHVTVHK